MQDRPLALPHVFTAEVTGDRVTTVGEWAGRVRRLATVLGLSADALGHDRERARRRPRPAGPAGTARRRADPRPELPRTSVGKFSKKTLRDRFAHHRHYDPRRDQ